MSVQIVKPSVVNGVEFYVSSDGTQSGVSVRGLARLCGVDVAGLSRIVNGKGSKALESFVGNIYYSDLSSEQGAKIITTEAATEIVFYYAFDSKASNDMAKFSAREFAKKGMHSWIKEITGFSTTDNNQALSRTINELFNNVNVLTQEMREWRTVRKVADRNMEGLNILIEEINENEQQNDNLSMKDLRSYTLLEWLEEEKGVQGLTHGQASKLGRAASETYKSLRQVKPSRITRRVRNRRNTGWMPSKVNGYTTEDFPILEVAYNEYLSR